MPARALTRRSAAIGRASLGVLTLVFAAALAVVLAVVPPGPARAAQHGLELVTHTTYVAAPSAGRIHVSIDATATALIPDTATHATSVTGITLVVQPGATAAAAATAIGNPLPVTVSAADEHGTTIELTFDREVGYGQAYPFTVSFDLADAGGEARRDVRVGTTLVAFPVWAFGSTATPGSSVEVHIPGGYAASVELGHLQSEVTASGATVLRSGEIAEALEWFAYVTAEAPGAFQEHLLALPIGDETATVVVRGWEDDPEWSARMTAWMRDGLPALATTIGLAWPVRGELRIEEAATSRLGPYAGVYDDRRHLIRVRYDADAFVALHEAAHAWFNARLIDERWIAEAFASLYAEEAGRVIGIGAQPYRLEPEHERYRIPLNAWEGIGAEEPATEDFAYAATYEVGRLIADRATIAGLQAVWAGIDARRSAYQPVHGRSGAEESGAVTQESWQRLLDLVEESSGERFDDIWRDWIVTDAELALLDERDPGRARYAAAVRAAGDWELPRRVRHAMAAWDFADAIALLEEAEAVVAQRDRIRRSAAALDLQPPDRLRAMFETGRSFGAAAVEAASELTALQAIARATDRVAAPPTPLESIGLLGSDPSLALASGRQAFEQGDSWSAEASARRAADERAAARTVGSDRVLLGGAALLAADGLVLAGIGGLRARRRSAARSSVAGAAAR